ncbi:MAG: hypothetical protein AAF570_09295 [Bacteroidota bacterium]
MQSSLTPRFTLFFALALGITFSACKKDPQEDFSTAGTMSCKYNGQDWTAIRFQNILIKGTDQASGVDSKRLDINAEAADGTQIILTITDYRDGIIGPCMLIGDYDVDITANQCSTTVTQNICPSAIGLYLPEPSEVFVTEPDSGGFIRLDICDGERTAISGAFEFNVYDATTGALHARITDGVFNDVRYYTSQ